MKRFLAIAIWLAGCGGRPEAWEQGFSAGDAVGLNGAVAVTDRTLDRMLVLTSPAPLSLHTHALPAGKNVTTVKASPDGKRLFVLSKGVERRINPEDERPRLTLIDTEGAPKVSRVYEFNAPLSGIELDPELEWAVLYATGSDGSTISNPNEIVLVDLVDLAAEPETLTIRSLGSRPQGFLFTRTLSVPNGDPRRLLVVRTEREVTLVDLSQRGPALAESQVTQAGLSHAPVEVAFHDREIVIDPTDNQEYEVEAELAVRLENDSTVLLLQLADPGAGSDKPFRLLPNLVNVGGVPSSIEFVRTDYGVRLVALSNGLAALVDPNLIDVTNVTLPKPFTRITRVTEDLETIGGADIALLWSSSLTTLGLWNLGVSTSSASRGLSTLEIGTAVRNVRDIPSDTFPTYKVLESQSGDFYVLDLESRANSPLATNGRQFSLNLSPDGQRLWAFQPGGDDFASVNLANLHPISLRAERAISGVFDISNGAGGRTAIVLHQTGGGLAATLLDATEPDSAHTRFFSGLAYGGLTHD